MQQQQPVWRLCVTPASAITCLSHTCAAGEQPTLRPYPEDCSLLLAMGNVALLSQGNDGALTPFQRSKLIFDFNTFFDLNKDGVLSYKDFLWAKDRICQISGWKVISEKAT